MDNAEEIMHFLEVFSKRKSKIIPPELNDYLSYVARTGDPVFQWGLVKGLFKEKLLCVLSDFYENTPGIDIPSYPNVDPFNYESMKDSLLERLDTFQSAPFTLQRICELLINPRKQYNRIDKFMRAFEKNILVVSTREPGPQCFEQDNGEPADAMNNGSDNNSDYNVDVEMEEVSWKKSRFNKYKAQPSSSNLKKSVEDDSDDDSKSPVSSTESQDDQVTEYESVTPPDDSVNDENDVQSDSTEEDKADDSSNSSDEVMPKQPKTDSKDEEESPVISKIEIQVEMIDKKESIAEVSESNSDADKPKEIANNEAIPVPTDDVKSPVTPIETEDSSPSDDNLNQENIEDVSPEEDISQDDDKMLPKSPEVSKNFEEAYFKKCNVQAKSVSEPPVKTQGNSENEAAVKVKEPEAIESTVKDIKASPKSPSSAYSPADSPTDEESTDSAIEADAKDDQSKIEQDLAEVADEKQALPDNDKTVANSDQIADKCEESSELTPDST